MCGQKIDSTNNNNRNTFSARNMSALLAATDDAVLLGVNFLKLSNKTHHTQQLTTSDSDTFEPARACLSLSTALQLVVH